MIYPVSFEQKTGFDTVRQIVAGLCVTPEAAQMAERMEFSSDYGRVMRLLESTSEMLAIVAPEPGGENAGDIGVGSLQPDGLRLLQSIRVAGSMLTGTDLAALASSMRAVDNMAAFMRKCSDPDGGSGHRYPRLHAIMADITPTSEITRKIDRIIDPYGNVLDNASPELAELRRSLQRLRGSLGSTMRRVLQRAIDEGYVEAGATGAVRDGRLVIPVQAMHKRKVSGIVHDQSATGRTVFIEPAEMVEANNRLRELESAERHEVNRILTAAADMLREHLPELTANLQIATEVDFIHAKALYAARIAAALPTVSAKPELEWYGARHPLLDASLQRQGRKIVPLDITLTPKDRILVISGPNAGGKSVAIKTVALVQYMVQCGLLPPMSDNSHIGLFKDILLDIGDDQSIDDDLSTFSSHLRNLRTMLRAGSRRSLFIIDEPGSGTEPQIGGALAQAVLEEFNREGMWGLVTTHYHNLKTAADSTPGLVNGSMLYDRQAMAPLFRLAVGHPGSSFAVEIARKSGLPSSVIDRAEELVGSDYVNLDKYLLDIARDRRYWADKRASIHQKEKKVDAALERYETQADELRRARREIIADARAKAEEILQQSNASIERTIHEIRRSQAERESTLEARRRLQKQREALAEASDRDTDAPEILRKAPKMKKRDRHHESAVPEVAERRRFTAGDTVKLQGQATPGRILEITGKKATVAFGSLKTTVDISRLIPSNATIHSGARSGATAVQSSQSQARLQQFRQEIDVRGMRVDEAVQAVQYYLDDAVQFRAGRVRILHGTGTGALRQYIRQYLSTAPGVDSFADEDVRFGGAGITVVNLS